MEMKANASRQYYHILWQTAKFVGQADGQTEKATVLLLVVPVSESQYKQRYGPAGR